MSTLRFSSAVKERTWAPGMVGAVKVDGSHLGAGWLVLLAVVEVVVVVVVVVVVAAAVNTHSWCNANDGFIVEIGTE